MNKTKKCVGGMIYYSPETKDLEIIFCSVIGGSEDKRSIENEIPAFSINVDVLPDEVRGKLNGVLSDR